MKKTGDATIEEIKTRENVWGSANLDLFMRWVSAAMTVQKLRILVAEDELEKLEKS